MADDSRMKSAWLLKDTLLVAAGKYSQYVVALISIPLIARNVGVEGFGSYSLGLAGFFLGTVAGDFGLTQQLAAIDRDAPRTKATRDTFLALRLIVVSLALAAVVIAAASGAQLALYVVSGCLIGAVSTLSEEWLAIADGRFGVLAASQLLGRIAFLVALLVFMPIFKSALVALLCLACSSLVPVASTQWWAYSYLGKPRRTSIRRLQDMAAYGLPGLGIRATATAVSQGLLVAAAPALGTAQIAIFSASDRVAKAAQSTMDAYAVASIPRNASRQAGGQLKSSYAKSASIAFIIAGLLAVCLFMAAPLVIDLLYGAGFENSVDVLRFQALLLPIAATSSYLSTSVLYVLGRVKSVFACTAGSAAVAIFAVPLIYLYPTYWTLLPIIATYELLLLLGIMKTAGRAHVAAKEMSR